MLVGVVTPGKTLHADVVVLAAALGIPELTKPLGLSVPLTAKPRTVTVITKPLKPILKHIVVNGTHQSLLLPSIHMPLHELNVSCKNNNFICRSYCSGSEATYLLLFGAISTWPHQSQVHQLKSTITELLLVNTQNKHSHESEPSYISHDCLCVRMM